MFSVDTEKDPKGMKWLKRILPASKILKVLPLKKYKSNDQELKTRCTDA